MSKIKVSLYIFAAVISFATSLPAIASSNPPSAPTCGTPVSPITPQPTDASTDFSQVTSSMLTNMIAQMATATMKCANTGATKSDSAYYQAVTDNCTYAQLHQNSKMKTSQERNAFNNNWAYCVAGYNAWVKIQ